jgi:hypothetical protein
MSGLIPRQLAGDRLGQLVAAIAALTVVSGGTQLVAPGFILDIIGGDSNETSRHFFAIVGMFMVVVGGLLLHGMLQPPVPSYVLLWCGLQKFGAAAAVGLGVGRDIFEPLALAVAGFDFLSGVLIAMLWWRLRATP